MIKSCLLDRKAGRRQAGRADHIQLAHSKAGNTSLLIVQQVLVFCLFVLFLMRQNNLPNEKIRHDTCLQLVSVSFLLEIYLTVCFQLLLWWFS